jgi:2-haloacid dehalogenase
MTAGSRAVVFDVGRVLIQWNLRFLFEKLIEDPGELDRFLATVVTEEWHFEHDRGRPLADMVPERIAMFPQHEALIRAYATRFNETAPGPIPGSLELVRRLHANGVPLFAITNFGHEFWEVFRPEWPIFDLFEDIVVSGTERLAKPDPAIFRLAEKRFGFPARDMVFTDDNPANIDAAIACGWQAHLFTDAPTLEIELEAAPHRSARALEKERPRTEVRGRGGLPGWSDGIRSRAGNLFAQPLQRARSSSSKMPFGSAKLVTSPTRLARRPQTITERDPPRVPRQLVPSQRQRTPLRISWRGSASGEASSAR